MNTLQILDIALWAVPASIGLALVGSLTRQAATVPDALPDIHSGQVPPQNSPVPEGSVPHLAPPNNSANKPQPTEPTYNSLQAACLGLLIAPVWLVIFLVNSYFLVQVLDVLSSGGSEILFTLDLWGWQREITDYDLVASLLCLCQFIAGASLYFSRQEQRDGFVMLISSVSLSGLLIFEVLGQVLRAWTLAGDTADLDVSVVQFLPVLGGVLALGTAAAEVLCGIYVIDHFIAPCLAIIARLLFFPFRYIDERLRHFFLCQPATPRPGSFAQAHGRPVGGRIKGLALSIARALDEAIFEPLRKLDVLIGTRLRRWFP